MQLAKIRISFDVTVLSVKIVLLDIELIRDSICWHDPPASYLSVSELALVLDKVGTDVLFVEKHVAIGSDLAVNLEFANDINTLSLNHASVDIHVVKVHVGSFAVLLVEAGPLLGDFGNLEGTTDAGNGPCTVDLIPCKVPMVVYFMFANVSFGKLYFSGGINGPADHEMSNGVLPLTLDLTASFCLEEFKDHAVLFAILDVVADPDGVFKVLCIEMALSFTVIVLDIHNIFLKIINYKEKKRYVILIKASI